MENKKWTVNAQGCDQFRNNVHTINGGQQMDAVNRSRLIEKAPEMLAMLKAANQAFFGTGTRKALLAALEGSKDLIRQAEGKD